MAIQVTKENKVRQEGGWFNSKDLDNPSPMKTLTERALLINIFLYFLYFLFGWISKFSKESRLLKITALLMSLG